MLSASRTLSHCLVWPGSYPHIVGGETKTRQAEYFAKAALLRHNQVWPSFRPWFSFQKVHLQGQRGGMKGVPSTERPWIQPPVPSSLAMWPLKTHLMFQALRYCICKMGTVSHVPAQGHSWLGLRWWHPEPCM